MKSTNSNTSIKQTKRKLDVVGPGGVGGGTLIFSSYVGSDPASTVLTGPRSAVGNMSGYRCV